MASFVSFHCLALDCGKGVHDFSADTLKIYLSNTAPDVAADTAYGDVPDLPTAGGYVAGGISLGANTWSQVNGLASLVAGANVVFTATTGFGPFRYAILYNDTAPAKNLIAYWDNGASVNVAATKTFEVDFSPEVLTLEFDS